MSYEQAVTGWADHLRSGGTTTWPAWLAESHPLVAETAHPLPSAVHLELVRRLNLAAPARRDGLADQVFSIASPGRGLIDVPLAWPEPRRFGSPAFDPAQLPEDELIRLAVGVLVHLLPGLPAPVPQPEHHPWPLPWRRRFRLHGSPGTVAAVRDGLLGQGLLETRWRPTHVVIARPVEVMMAEHWAATARLGGILKWTTLWRRAEADGRLPAPIDVAALAGRLSARVDPRREPVHVVVARDAQAAGELTARLLRARPGVTAGSGDPAQTDLLRRVNRLTALVQGPARVRDLSARLALALEDAPPTDGVRPPPWVPRESLAWARAQATAMADDLREAGYAVHGSPDDLSPADHQHSGTIDRTRTLELAVEACLRTWDRQGGTP